MMYIQKTMHNMIYVTGVYSVEIIDIYHTINVINVKPCMMALLIELYLFMALTIFQGHRCVNMNCKLFL